MELTTAYRIALRGGLLVLPPTAVDIHKCGQKLPIKIQDAIYHPGHYRIALAVNSRAEIPSDPEVTRGKPTEVRGPCRRSFRNRRVFRCPPMDCLK
jgi:hypothetical protein